MDNVVSSINRTCPTHGVPLTNWQHPLKPAGVIMSQTCYLCSAAAPSSSNLDSNQLFSNEGLVIQGLEEVNDSLIEENQRLRNSNRVLRTVVRALRSKSTELFETVDELQTHIFETIAAEELADSEEAELG